MDILQKVLHNFNEREAKQNLKKRMLQLLALLGGIPKKKTAQDDDDEISEKEEQTRLFKQILNKQRNDLQKKKSKWNKLFDEVISPHIGDMGEYKSGKFFDYAFGLLKAGRGNIGELNAINFFEDAATHVIKNIERFVSGVHGKGGSKYRREPYATIREVSRRDPNYDVLTKKGSRFRGKIIGETPGDPYKYTVELSGGGLTKKRYKIDASKSMLDLEEGDPYKIEVSSHMGSDKGRDVILILKGAEKDIPHSEIFSRQVPKVIAQGIDDYVRGGEYKKDLNENERLDRELKKNQQRIDIVKKKIEEAEIYQTPEKKGKKTLERLKKDLENLKKTQLKLLDNSSIQSQYKIQEELKEEPKFKEEREKYEDTHKLWYGFEFTPGTVDLGKGKPDDRYLNPKKKPYGGPLKPETSFNSEVATKLEKDLSNSLNDEGDYKGIPYRKLIEMMMDSIGTVDDPLKDDSWKSKFLEVVEDYANKAEGVDLKIPKGSGARSRFLNDFIGTIQEKILTDKRFKRLQDNLAREYKREFFRKADFTPANPAEPRKEFKEFDMDKEQLEDIKNRIEKLWDTPVSNEKQLKGLYKRIRESEMSRSQAKSHVEKPLLDSFKKYLGTDLKKAMEALKTVEDHLSGYPWLVDRMKWFLLLELWHIEEDDIQEKVDRFIDYRDMFKSEQESIKTNDMRKKIVKDIDDFLRVSPLLLKHKKKKTRRPKSPPKTLTRDQEEVKDTIREKDKGLMTEFRDIFKSDPVTSSLLDVPQPVS